jgi:hypothetical protein
MFGRWLNNLKWALVLAIFAGPAVAYFTWTEANAIRHVVADGVRADAVVDGGMVRSGRRSGRSYTLHAIWQTEAGQRAEDVKISTTFADQIILDDAIMIDAVSLLYLPSEPDAPIVVADDADNQLADKQNLIWLGIGAGILGLVVSPIWFLIEARNRKKQGDDVDATLAQMRAGQQAPQ